MWLKRLLGIFYLKKEIVFISNSRILRKRVTALECFISLFFLFWFSYATFFYFVSKKILNSKDYEIAKQIEINVELSERIKSIDLVVSNVVDYMKTLNYYDRFEKVSMDQGLDIKGLKNEILLSDSRYSEVLPMFENIGRNINNLNEIVAGRINGLENILSKETKLMEKTKEMYNVSFSKNQAEGGVVSEVFKKSNLIKEQSVEKNIKYLNFLETFLTSIPVSKPMKNYFLTSKFGARMDPFTEERREHRGLDFVGAMNSKVLVSADGIVEKVGVGSGFGKVVMVNHGNNIKTIYGHLKETLVDEGDIVKRGDEIAVQGSTGRSTGDHLHYEIKINNENVDPIKFVDMGEKFF